jgi:hypothetical protein
MLGLDETFSNKIPGWAELVTGWALPISTQRNNNIFKAQFITSNFVYRPNISYQFDKTESRRKQKKRSKDIRRKWPSNTSMDQGG